MSIVRPILDRVLVKRIDEDDVSPGGIIIPDKNKEKPSRGVVIDVGPGIHDDRGQMIKMDVSRGDTVIFPRYAGNTIAIDGEDHLMMREVEIMAILGPAT